MTNEFQLDYIYPDSQVEADFVSSKCLLSSCFFVQQLNPAAHESLMLLPAGAAVSTEQCSKKNSTFTAHALKNHLTVLNFRLLLFETSPYSFSHFIAPFCSCSCFLSVNGLQRQSGCLLKTSRSFEGRRGAGGGGVTVPATFAYLTFQFRQDQDATMNFYCIK